MSYANYLIKVGGSAIPNQYIKSGTYAADVEKQVVGSYTDANGVDHFETLPYKKLNVELSISDCDAEIYESIISLIRSAIINQAEDNLIISAYVPRLNNYVTQEVIFECDMPKVHGIRNGRIIYQDVTFTFRGKGGAVT